VCELSITIAILAMPLLGDGKGKAVRSLSAGGPAGAAIAPARGATPCVVMPTAGILASIALILSLEVSEETATGLAPLEPANQPRLAAAWVGGTGRDVCSSPMGPTRTPGWIFSRLGSLISKDNEWSTTATQSAGSLASRGPTGAPQGTADNMGV
jgi:hypothetical protein